MAVIGLLSFFVAVIALIVLVAYCIAQVAKRSKRIHNTSAAISGRLIAVLSLLFIGGSLASWVGLVHNKDVGAPALTKDAAGNDSHLTSVESVVVRGQSLRRGMTADQVFNTVHKADEIDSVWTTPDPSLPSSQIVYHRYYIGPQEMLLKFKRESNESPYTLSDILTKNTGRRPLNPFLLDTSNVGPYFRGDSAQTVVAGVTSVMYKDEFESSSEYEKRAAKLKQQPIFGDATVNDYLAFVQQEIYSGPTAVWEGARVSPRYNADTHLLNVGIDLGAATDGGPILGPDGPGLDLVGRFSRPKDLSIPMDPAEARESKVI